MKINVIRAFILLTVIILVIVFSYEKSPIIGKWIQVDRSGNDLGGTFIFRPDGKAIMQFGVMVESTYKVENQSLIETLTSPKAHLNEADTKEFHMSLSENSLSLKQRYPVPKENETVDIKMNRIGSPPDKKFLLEGLWSFEHESGVIAFKEFAANGNALLSIPVVHEQFDYQLKDGTLTMAHAKGASYTRQIQLKENLLILLEEPGKKKEVYMKFK